MHNVLCDIIEGTEFMAYTGAHHQGMVKLSSCSYDIHPYTRSHHSQF